MAPNNVQVYNGALSLGSGYNPLFSLTQLEIGDIKNHGNSKEHRRTADCVCNAAECNASGTGRL